MTIANMSLPEAKLYFAIIDPDIKMEAGITPFLTFPLLKSCNFHCNYCGEGGELSASMVSQWDHEKLIKVIYIAHRLSVRKFRLTGGEPFLYKHIIPVIETFSKIGCYTHINTNGSFVLEYEQIIAKLNSNMHFVVSLDTLKKDKFNYIAQTKNGLDYCNTLAGIQLLKKHNRLLRINMVVTSDNIDEVFNMIDFCSDVGCDLKLLDVVSVPLPFGDRKSLHVSLNAIEEKLHGLAENMENHEYARSFGTPCKIYVYKNVRITLKNTWNGSRYDINGICNGCEYFPCHEGLYDVFVLPDGRVLGCRWSDTSVAGTNPTGDRYQEEGDFEEALKRIFRVFRCATYFPRKKNEIMRPKPYLVIHSLETAKSSKQKNNQLKGSMSEMPFGEYNN